ncbi:hypothetical protein EBR43_04550, partial [bacterium]|nr:hypothetical protein [bacterium]
LAAYTAFNHVAELINSANTKKTSDFFHDYCRLAKQDAVVIYNRGEKLVDDTSKAVMQNDPSLILRFTPQGNGAALLNTIKSSFGFN